MWDCCKNYMNEVEISEEKIGLDAVKEVGHGHNFLKANVVVFCLF